MPPRNIYITRDTDNSDASKDCTAWDSELLKGVLICVGLAVVLFVALCEVLVRRHKQKQGRVRAEQKVKDLKGIIELYIKKYDTRPQQLIEEEESSPGRHTSVASGSQTPASYVRWNARLGGSGANGDAASDRFRPRDRAVPENARPGSRTLPEGSNTFVVGTPESEDIRDQIYSASTRRSSSRDSQDRQRDGQVSPLSSNASVRDEHEAPVSTSSGRSLTHGRRGLAREQQP